MKTKLGKGMRELLALGSEERVNNLLLDEIAINKLLSMARGEVGVGGGQDVRRVASETLVGIGYKWEKCRLIYLKLMRCF